MYIVDSCKNLFWFTICIVIINAYNVVLLAGREASDHVSPSLVYTTTCSVHFLGPVRFGATLLLNSSTRYLFSGPRKIWCKFTTLVFDLSIFRAL